MLVDTTVGRVILNQNLPAAMPYINGVLKKKGLQDLVSYCFIKFGNDNTVTMLDELKEVCFDHATKAGISIGIDDMVVPDTKIALMDKADDEVQEIEKQRSAGVITAGERHNKIIDIWHRVTEKRSGGDVRADAERGGGPGRVQPDPDGWRTPAPAARSSRSGSWPACVA